MATEQWKIEQNERCACCGSGIISEWNNEAREQALCDDCYNELFNSDGNEIIGYLKGE